MNIYHHLSENTHRLVLRILCRAVFLLGLLGGSGHREPPYLEWDEEPPSEQDEVGEWG